MLLYVKTILFVFCLSTASKAALVAIGKYVSTPRTNHGAMLDIAAEVALIAWGFYVLGAADK